MASEIRVLGAGGHCAVMLDALKIAGSAVAIKLYDDTKPAALPPSCEYAGSLADGLMVSDNRSAKVHVVLAIGDATLRLQLYKSAVDNGLFLPSVVHEKSVVSSDVILPGGTFVAAGAVVNPGVTLGPACIINTSSVVDHHCKLGAAVHVCPGVTLAGRVSIGDKSWVGVGTCVRDGVSIGHEVFIGAGSVVVSDIPNGDRVFGNPAVSQTIRTS